MTELSEKFNYLLKLYSTFFKILRIFLFTDTWGSIKLSVDLNRYFKSISIYVLST